MNTRNLFKSGFLRAALMLTFTVMTFPTEAWAQVPENTAVTVTIGDNTTYYNVGSSAGEYGDAYNALVAAVSAANAATSDVTVKLYEDVNLGRTCINFENTCTVGEGQNTRPVTITLDLNGKTLSGTYTNVHTNIVVWVKENTSLTITNNGNSGGITAEDGFCIYNGGTLTLNGSPTLIGYFDCINNYGTLTLNGSPTLISDSYCINNNGTLTLNGQTTFSCGNLGADIYVGESKKIGIGTDFAVANNSKIKVYIGNYNEFPYTFTKGYGANVKSGGDIIAPDDIFVFIKDNNYIATPKFQLVGEGDAAEAQACLQDPIQVAYIDANGKLHDNADGQEGTDDDMALAYKLTGTEMDLGKYGTETWYVTDFGTASSMTYNQNIEIDGTVHIILANGKHMKIGNSIDDPINDNGITTTWNFHTTQSTIYFYGQSTDYSDNANACGKLSVYSTYSSISSEYNLTINGGKIEAYSTNGNGISAFGDITINGGQVTANGGTNRNGISAGGDITLGWIHATDFIKASSYNAENGVKIADEQTLYIGTTAYNGTVSDPSTIAGKRLTPDLWGIASGKDGSETKPYTITNTAGLDLLAKMVNGTDGYAANDFSGKYFVLGNDITYTHKQAGETGADTENNYTAIGGWYSNFQGTFDGQGHTVSGIRIYKGGSDREDKLQGLFGNINGGTVCHVTLDDAQITGDEGTGGIVGINNRGNITDCHVTENVCISAQQNTSSHGGIVGDNGGSVNGCTSKAKIKTSSSSCNQFGGIAGCNGLNGTMKDCLYLGSEVEGYSYVGAVAGGNYGSIINCYYTNVLFFGKGAGDIPISGNNAIGINNGTVTNTGLARTITLGEGVTLNGTATSYGPASPNTSDVRITSYATAADQPGFVLKLETVSGTTTTTTTTTYYSTSGATVALGYSGTLPTGCSVDYVVTAAGSNVAVSETNTFVMPNDNVTVSTKLYMKNVPYIGWDDTNKTYITDAKTPDGTKVWVLTGGGATTLPGGWYVVNNHTEGVDAAYTGQLKFTGDVHLILCDGAAMTVVTSESPISDEAIYGNEASIAIYGQSTGDDMGSLTATSSSIGNGIYAYSLNGDCSIIINGGQVTASCTGYGCGIVAYAPVNGYNSSVIINGGQVNATGGTNGYGIEASSNNGYNSSVIINGGQVNATGGTNGYGIYAYSREGIANITLGWTKPTDFIQASSYYVSGGNSVKIPQGKYLYKINDNNSTTVWGYADSEDVFDVSEIAGKTLRPAMTIASNQCVDICITDGCWKLLNIWAAYAVIGYDTATGTVTLSEVLAGVPEDVPVILVPYGAVNTNILTVASSSEADAIRNSVPTNRSSLFTVGDGEKTMAELIAEATGTSGATGEYMVFTLEDGMFRAASFSDDSKPAKGKCFLVVSKWDVFQMIRNGVTPPTNGARGIPFDLGEATGISLTPSPSPKGEGSEYWYSLDGRKLSKAPTKKGVYIRSGVKVIIK